MVLNITAAMQPIWDIIGNVVDNTSAIVGLVIIGVVIGVAVGIKYFITRTLQTSMGK